MLAGQVEVTLETMDEEPEVAAPKKAAKGKKHTREAEVRSLYEPFVT